MASALRARARRRTTFNGKPVSLLPLYGDGSLVCAPTTMNSSSHPCVLLSASIYSETYLKNAVALSKCRRAAKRPTGVPCTQNSYGNTSPCAFFTCFGPLLNMYSTILSGGVYNGFLDLFWVRYAPDMLPSRGCFESSINTIVAYMGQMDYAAACGLPPAFASNGWTCPLPSPSQGPPVAASPSAPPTSVPGQSPSSTPRPSSTPLPGLAVIQAGIALR